MDCGCSVWPCQGLLVRCGETRTCSPVRGLYRLCGWVVGSNSMTMRWSWDWRLWKCRERFEAAPTHHLDDPRPLVIAVPFPLRQTVFALLSVLLVYASTFHPKSCPVDLRLLPIPTRHHRPEPKSAGALSPPLLCIQQARKGL